VDIDPIDGSYGVGCGRCINAAAEFMSVFYEENCPPITIVAGEDAEIDSE
jgi:bacterioferritin-associated ferredoxin